MGNNKCLLIAEKSFLSHLLKSMNSIAIKEIILQTVIGSQNLHRKQHESMPSQDGVCHFILGFIYPCKKGFPWTLPTQHGYHTASKPPSSIVSKIEWPNVRWTNTRHKIMQFERTLCLWIMSCCQWNQIML